MTYDITFLEQERYYFAFRDREMVGVAFDKTQVHRDYVHLLGASASMYETLGNIQTETYKLSQLLDDNMKNVNKEDEANVKHLIDFLHNIQDTCLNMRRLAEVGTSRLTFELEAQNKVKKA